ncbi:hypothetical protein CTAYLR_005190 [Chrysophaeum taylorii]|uniref:Aminoglycoside phosphotransferase domain-containing protein n=1 Tax=Chrysophaeum taylorii TaxID=2483200 RepID=A0AAD7XUM2_9STRA|nr:hypothetical protein CTAYLR_005190 [Chrysophaeum taylorii]
MEEDVEELLAGAGEDVGVADDDNVEDFDIDAELERAEPSPGEDGSPSQEEEKPQKKVPWSLYKKSLSRVGRGVVTGFDVTSPEELSKREARLSRWEPEKLAAAKRDEEEAEKRAKRLARFGVAGAEGGVAWARFSATLAALQLEASQLYGVDEGRETAAAETSERLHARVLPVDRGSFKKLRSADLLAHFGRYSPTYVEWLGDEACNVWFAEQHTAGRAMAALTVEIPPAPASLGLQQQQQVDLSAWRLLSSPVRKARDDKWGKKGAYGTRLFVSEYVESLGVLEAPPFTATEIVGGNLNYAWRVEGEKGSVFVKQAPEYIKCLGKDFGLTAQRIAVEVAALREFHRVGFAPEVLHFDKDRCVAIMQDLKSFVLLRDELAAGRVDARLAAKIGAAVSRLPQDTTYDWLPDNNAAMRGIIRDYVFAKPFVDDPTNRSLEPPLGLRAAHLRQDPGFLEALKKARAIFDKRDCLAHGDLHAGSLMTDGETVVAIDAEFAFVGPRGFDLAFATAGYVFAYCASTAWATPDDAALRRRKAKDAISALWTAYGDLQVLPEAVILCACELMRRVLGAASVPDLSEISDPALRNSIDLLVLDLGALLLKHPPSGLPDFLISLDDAYDAHVFATPATPSN